MGSSQVHRAARYWRAVHPRLDTLGVHRASPNGAFLREFTCYTTDCVLTSVQLLKDRAVWSALGIGFFLMLCEFCLNMAVANYANDLQLGLVKLTSSSSSCGWPSTRVRRRPLA